MLRPTPMKHVRLLILTEDLAQASLALAETESFHPDIRAPLETRLDAMPAHAYRETYSQARARLDKITRLIALDPLPSISAVRAVEADELGALNDWLGEIWTQTSNYEERLRRLDESERRIDEHQAALANFAALDIDLGMLRNKTRFLEFYVGALPRENLKQLEDALGLAGHLLHVYMQQEERAYVVIVGPVSEREAQLSSLLSSAGFQALPIPQALDRTPALMQQDLDAERKDIQAQRHTLMDELQTWGATVRERLCSAHTTLALAEPLVTLDPSLRSNGHLAHLAGWVPARAVDGLRGRLDQSLQRPFDLNLRDPYPDERSLVPTVATRNRLLAPFTLLVKQYGIPEYGEVDPTPLFAITFLLMFGTMFGDVGQGAVIALAAYLLRHRLGRFWSFGLFAGLSSMCFGALFGSIFGYEHVIPALWMSPLSDPILMLTLALGWGVVFLTIACLLAIYNRIVIDNWSDAFLGHHGVVNLIFYLALVSGGLGTARQGEFGLIPTLLIIAALVTLALHSWRHQQGPTFERVLVVFIETLETIIGYVSNTLSFLRVAAFSLNHVALSIAVFTLAGMMGGFGHVVTIVLGNLFILVLEGGIVMIQVMRLQYYEGFSRYFSGAGHAFAPLRLRRS